MSTRCTLSGKRSKSISTCKRRQVVDCVAEVGQHGRDLRHDERAPVADELAAVELPRGPGGTLAATAGAPAVLGPHERAVGVADLDDVPQASVIWRRMSPNRGATARLDHQRERQITEYFEQQTHGDNPVRHAAKLQEYTVRGLRFEVWDVLAQSGRWWVITHPMNLYSQDKFPVLDEVFTFHLGLALRVVDRPEPFASDEEQKRFGAAWRKWTQAALSVDEADEAEAFQAIGVLCREALIAMVKVGRQAIPIADAVAPKASDVVGWCGQIADLIAPGDSRARVRSHLKSVSKSSWELVNWLTHTSSATRQDAALAVSAVEHVLSAFGSAVVRYERGEPDQCPECGSHKLVAAGESPLVAGAVTICEVCGWEDYGGADPSSRAFVALDQPERGT